MPSSQGYPRNHLFLGAFPHGASSADLGDLVNPSAHLQQMSCKCLKYSQEASKAGNPGADHESLLAPLGTPYRVRVVVVDTDGAELRRDAATVCEELPRFAIRAYPELVGQCDAAERWGASTHNHLREEPRVDNETEDGQQQQHDQRCNQPEEHPVGHDGHLVLHAS